jgi:hypothetical protein
VPQTWDVQADVIVVGFGGAAASARAVVQDTPLRIVPAGRALASMLQRDPFQDSASARVPPDATQPPARTQETADSPAPME